MATTQGFFYLSKHFCKVHLHASLMKIQHFSSKSGLPALYSGVMWHFCQLQLLQTWKARIRKVLPCPWKPPRAASEGFHWIWRHWSQCSGARETEVSFTKKQCHDWQQTLSLLRSAPALQDLILFICMLIKLTFQEDTRRHNLIFSMFSPLPYAPLPRRDLSFHRLPYQITRKWANTASAATVTCGEEINPSGPPWLLWCDKIYCP